MSVHAATKYIGGHSDVLLGAIVANAETFPALHRLWTDMGVTPSHDDCFLGLRGLRTLPVRMQRHEASALEIAPGCVARPEVARCSIRRCPAIAGMRCGSAIFAARPACSASCCSPSTGAIDRMLDGMRTFGMGWSWGGFESLMIPTLPERARTVTRWEPGWTVATRARRARGPAGLDRGSGRRLSAITRLGSSLPVTRCAP